MTTRRRAAVALTWCALAAFLSGCSAGDEPAPPGEPTVSPSTAVTSAAASSEATPSPTVDSAGQACDGVKAIEANGFRTNPQELYDAAEAGTRSSVPAISDKARLLAAYSAMASASIQTGGDPAQHMRQLGGMVLDLLAACRENGHG
ncbi:hypothetical protein [Saccharopolyspora erythraea]|uniref:hypothetical protein n=1 Tax=Saccharopolyspora erythraea TaxID=1836 RepID=UPI002011ED46|nr:hypothetical protein [Saccharopolyspora erythraea]